MTCLLCGQTFSTNLECRSCGELFCDDCFEEHFKVGPHEVTSQGEFTAWWRGQGKTWPRRLIGEYAYTDDGTGRGIWIPAVEIDSWFTVEGKRI